MLARTDTEALLRQWLPTRAEAVLRLGRPAIELLPTALMAEPDATGLSRFGGRPALPEEIDWPLDGSEPLIFLAQLNLAELAPHDREHRLPPMGMLWFFASWNACMGATFPVGAAWHVFFRANPAGQARRQPPPAEIWLGEPLYPEILPNYALAFRSFLSLPHPFSQRYARLRLSKAEQSALFAVHSAMDAPSGLPTCHQVLGYPHPLQQQVEDDLMNYWSPARGKPRNRDGRHLQLLLQLDSILDDASMKYCWGDAGKLYFMLHERDLAARRFDRTMFHMQCG